MIELRIPSDVSDRDIGCGDTYPAGVEDIVIPSFTSRLIQQRNIISFYILSSSCFQKMSHSPDEMLPPKEPLQRLPQQPLISPTGARLVLCNNDTGYPGHTDPGRGRWVDNIESEDTKTFLRLGNVPIPYDFRKWEWTWPAVVLTPEEYKLRVGGMPVTELRRQLEKYWGRGGIPGAAIADDDYQDMWVPAWAPETTDDPYVLSWDSLFKFKMEEIHRLDPTKFHRLDCTIFSRWVNRECAQWLSYFIEKNHTLGIVHAWFAAFLGVTRESLDSMVQLSWDDPATVHWKFRMSFDQCIKDYDEVVDAIPSLPFNTKITTNQHGLQIISNKIDGMVPRRVWDICANTIIPATWFFGPPCGFSNIYIGVKPISHAWVADGDLTYIITEANQGMWPIPLPRGVQLEDIRGEMIRLGVRYAWLDVLCLRQQFRPALAKDLATTVPVNMEIVERHNECREKEWKVDVPTIGAIYSELREFGIYRGGPIVIFMSGLGRPFRDEGWASERHWLRRAWTIQETPDLSKCLIAGLPGGVDYEWQGTNSGSRWPWNCKVCNVLSKFTIIYPCLSLLS